MKKIVLSLMLVLVAASLVFATDWIAKGDEYFRKAEKEVTTDLSKVYYGTMAVACYLRAGFEPNMDEEELEKFERELE